MNRAELKCKFEAGKQAIRKAVDFQLGFLGEDGSYIWDGYVSDAYHKQAYSWNLVGNNEEAHRLLTWIRDTRLRPDGSLILTDDPNDTVNNVDLYKHSWTCQGAHRLGRFDVSYPIYQFIKTCERPCGGFRCSARCPPCHDDRLGRCNGAVFQRHRTCPALCGLVHQRAGTAAGQQ